MHKFLVCCLMILLCLTLAIPALANSETNTTQYEEQYIAENGGLIVIYSIYGDPGDGDDPV